MASLTLNVLKLADNTTIWIKPADNKHFVNVLPMSVFKEGDLINYTLPDRACVDGAYVGEIVAIEGNTLQVHYLYRTELYEKKLWRFNETETHVVSPEYIIRHVGTTDATLTKEMVRKMWDAMGYVVGLHDYCLKQDENHVVLDMTPGDSDGEEEEEEIADEMKDFIVPDSQGEAFCHPDMSQLTKEQQQWVDETHRAVKDWENWQPEDEEQRKIKNFVDNMTAKYSVKEDERQFLAGNSSLELSNPPVLGDK